jgi:acyl-CoA reductase-like NAD-dependent aldehyde dehydrogenase
MATPKTTSKTAVKTEDIATKTNQVAQNENAENAQVSNERIKVLKTYKIYIGGQFPRTESGRYYLLSLTDKSVVNVCLSSRKDFRNAVVKAREAQESWASRSALNRSQILYRIAEMLETRSAQFVEEMILQGSSKAAAKLEVEQSVDRLIYYAGWCDKYNPIFSSVNPVSSSHFNFSSTEPMGVITLIASQKSALLGLISVVAPAIASGNTCVVLASNSKPLCAITFAEVLNSSDLPGGVVNIMTGEVKELLPHFSNHMDVNAIYLCTDNVEEKKLVETNSSLNVKRARIETEQDWADSKCESPYRIMDFLEVKTTWHPIGI